MKATSADAASGAPAQKSGAAAALHIPTLDGLRAISFAIVFLAHAGLGDRIPGGFGVTVFFFLSGYLIATLMRVEIERTGSISFRNFYMRRVLRIFPPFYLVLTVAVVLSLLHVLPARITLAPTLAQAFHFANYWQVLHGGDGQPAGTGVYWSLAVEEHFYLIFPWLYLALHQLVPANRRALVLLSVCAAVLGWRLYLVNGLGVETNRTYLATDTRFDSLLFGCALATTGNPVLDRPGQPATRLWKWLLLPLGVAALLFSFLYRGTSFRETYRYTVQGLALFPIFIVGIREPNWGPFALLNLRWVKFAGLLSYSLYLTHQLVLFALEAHTGLPAVPRAVLAAVLSVALAIALHQYVELPSARLRKRWASSPIPAPEPELRANSAPSAPVGPS